MSIRYRIVQNKMRGTANFGKWYGRATILDEISTRELADDISHSTTVTYADVLAVLTELSRQMKVHLQNSQRVVLDGIGAFKVGLRTQLVENSKKTARSLAWAASRAIALCILPNRSLSLLATTPKATARVSM